MKILAENRTAILLTIVEKSTCPIISIEDSSGNAALRQTKLVYFQTATRVKFHQLRWKTSESSRDCIPQLLIPRVSDPKKPFCIPLWAAITSSQDADSSWRTLSKTNSTDEFTADAKVSQLPVDLLILPVMKPAKNDMLTALRLVGLSLHSRNWRNRLASQSSCSQQSIQPTHYGTSNCACGFIYGFKITKKPEYISGLGTNLITNKTTNVPSWTVDLWAINVQLRSKDFPQISHKCGLLPNSGKKQLEKQRTQSEIKMSNADKAKKDACIFATSSGHCGWRRLKQ